jgi:chemotaxis protein MotB
MAKCPPCPEGIPAWMATFSDLVTLLLTFFVLLLSFAKTETAKYNSAFGSIRNAFGGGSQQAGAVPQVGKTPDDAPTMLEAQEEAKPFPIDFLTTEGFLDKHEINRASDEELKIMRKYLLNYEMADMVNVYEMPEAIKVQIKDHILFEEGSTKIKSLKVEAFEKMVNLLKKENWVVFVEGHAAPLEKDANSGLDAFSISAQRAISVSRVLIQKGVEATRINTIFYGDTRPQKFTADRPETREQQRRVEFVIRKTDLRLEGHKLPSRK